MNITQSKRILELGLFVKWLIPDICLAEVGLLEEEKANEIILGYLNHIMFLKDINEHVQVGRTGLQSGDLNFK